MTGGTSDGDEYFTQTNRVYSTVDGTSFRQHANMPMGLGSQCQVWERKFRMRQLSLLLLSQTRSKSTLTL